jgi:hypothetical protein
MNAPNEDLDRAAQRLGQVLRGLPPRAAPRTLEARVLREIERRAAQPWWLRSFAHWPVGARAAFLLLCAAALGAAFFGTSIALDAFRSMHDAGALASSPAHRLFALASAAQQIWTVLVDIVPTGWLRAALAATTLLYVMLFTLGAVAYRWLYVSPLRQVKT